MLVHPGTRFTELLESQPQSFELHYGKDTVYSWSQVNSNLFVLVNSSPHNGLK